MLGNMFPKVPADGPSHGAPINVVFASNSGAWNPGRIQHPSRANDVLCQLCVAVRCPFHVASFRLCVSVVIRIRSCKKMLGAYARRIIATVKNTEPVWNEPVVQLPRYSVSLLMMEDSVAVLNSGDPDPARPKFGAEHCLSSRRA